MATKVIAVLMTVHNRRDKTLACLNALHGQDPIDGCSVDVWLTDDGCTDGTAEAVKEKYPTTNIVQGDGNLFWNRGMYRAWEAAAKAKDYDYYLWLNDDTELLQNALTELIATSLQVENTAIIVGSTRARTEEKLTYGGILGKQKVEPTDIPRHCDTFNGNIVLVPRDVFAVLGNLDWTYRHAIGDLDYGCRARRAGINIFVAPGYLGLCDNNPKLPAWARKDVSLKKRLRNLYSPLGYAEPLPFFHFDRKNYGLITAIKHFITIHIRVLFPQLWER